jgi:dihydrofolate reductase
MRKIVLLMGTTVDGYDAGGWIPDGAMELPEVQREVWTQLDSIDTFIMGRLSHELWYAFWPKQRTSESAFDAHFSQFADDVQKVVVSNTLTASEWKNARVIGGDLRSRIAELKRQPGKDIAIVGGATVGRAIGELGLIDEYRLWIHPTITGKGTSVFGITRITDLRLVDAKQFTGVLTAHYARTAVT